MAPWKRLQDKPAFSPPNLFFQQWPTSLAACISLAAILFKGNLPFPEPEKQQGFLSLSTHTQPDIKANTRTQVLYFLSHKRRILPKSVPSLWRNLSPPSTPLPFPKLGGTRPPTTHQAQEGVLYCSPGRFHREGRGKKRAQGRLFFCKDGEQQKKDLGVTWFLQKLTRACICVRVCVCVYTQGEHFSFSQREGGGIPPRTALHPESRLP